MTRLNNKGGGTTTTKSRRGNDDKNKSGNNSNTLRKPRIFIIVLMFTFSIFAIFQEKNVLQNFSLNGSLRFDSEGNATSAMVAGNNYDDNDDDDVDDNDAVDESKNKEDDDGNVPEDLVLSLIHI